ncbi:MAG: threonine--tRNA ligase [Myxococcales bacterium]|nr:threonine--tRNA ligase [Myxococcales bacterium]
MLPAPVPEPDREPERALDPGDHRALAARLDLLHLQDDAPGMVFWHPRGWTLFRLLEDAARRHVVAGGYREVRTPQLLRRGIWETSGHWDHFRADMFAVGDGATAAALKPVSCPGHVQLVKRAAPSWRDLPIRLAEMGLVHRDEPGGTLHGLFRLRQFTQDDGHVFCADDQVAAELARFCRDLPAFYRGFGLDDVSVALSTRPAERAGDDAWWDRAERDLDDVVRALAIPCVVQPGAGAFYGPKLEFVVRDRRGRPWQLGTIQLDRVMPQRFEVRYVDAGGARRPCVMLHRALYGSIERFLGVLLEHHGAQLPAWLAPEQVVIAPVTSACAPWAEAVATAAAAAGLRARLELDGTLGRRVAAARELGVPLVAVVGAREVAAGAVAVRDARGSRVLALPEAIAAMTAAAAPPA